MKRSGLMLAATLSLLLGTLPAHTQSVPLLLNHQGLLIGADGLPMEGLVSFHFALYDQAEGGDLLWVEDSQLELIDGYYQVQLGHQSDLGGRFGGEARYLGISLNGGAELSPRHRVVSVPYALVAANAVGDITPRSITVGGQPVIDENGEWVGPLVPGAADGVGYDTPQEVLEALRTVDGADSGVDADLLDALESSQLMRSDRSTGTTGGMTVDGLLHVGESTLLGPARSLVLGNAVNANGIDADRPSGVLGFAGFGVRHGAMGWYPHRSRFELYDTSPANPNDDYPSGSRPYLSLRAQNLEAMGQVDAQGGLSVGGNQVVDASGHWVGAQIGNADTLDGLHAADFAQANHQHFRIFLVTDGWSNGCDPLNIGADCFGYGCQNCFIISPALIYGTAYRDGNCSTPYNLHGSCSLADCKFGINSSNCGGGCPSFGGGGLEQKQHIYYGNNTRFHIMCFGS